MSSHDSGLLPAKKRIVTYGKTAKKRPSDIVRIVSDGTRHHESELLRDDARPANHVADQERGTEWTQATVGASQPPASSRSRTPELKSKLHGGQAEPADQRSTSRKRKLDTELAPTAGNKSTDRLSIKRLASPAVITEARTPKLIQKPGSHATTEQAPDRGTNSLKQATLPSYHRIDQVKKPQAEAVDPPIGSRDSLAGMARAGGRRGQPRLIDTLATQADLSGSDSESSSAGDLSVGINSPAVNLSRSSPGLGRVDQDAPSRLPLPSARPMPTPKARNIKYTYSQQRSMLADAQYSGGLDPEQTSNPFDISNQEFAKTLPKRPALPRPLSFSDDDMDDDAIPAGTIRSVHELRQAGANNRFADEVDDLFERIGKAGGKQLPSMRRNALLELASRLQQKAFVRQLRDHGIPESLFSSIGEEQDLVSAYALACIAVLLLASSATTHLSGHFPAVGFSSMLARLLGSTEDIMVIASQRRSNMSKVGQSSLAEAKTAVLQLAVWDLLQPVRLSPRTLALKLLDICCKSPNDDGGRSVAALAAPLFEIVALYSTPDYWEGSSSGDLVDAHLASSILERQSIHVMETEEASRWTSIGFPRIASTLAAVLGRPVDCYGDFEWAVIKLALNTTNNNPEVASVFGDNGVLGGLARSICDGFDLLYHPSDGRELRSEVFDGLVLMLGIMINFMEHCPSIREAASEQTTDDSPFERLIAIFLENYTSMSEADSVEKTRLNVAFGYLSVLLGYLSLSEAVQRRFSAKNADKGLQSLIESIRVFIALHKTLDKKSDTAEVTVRLEGLVDALEGR